MVWVFTGDFLSKCFQLKSFDTLYSKFNRKMVDNFAEKHLGRKTLGNHEFENACGSFEEDTRGWFLKVDNLCAVNYEHFQIFIYKIILKLQS